MLTDVQTPFLGTPLVLHKIRRAAPHLAPPPVVSRVADVGGSPERSAEHGVGSLAGKVWLKKIQTHTVYLYNYGIRVKQKQRGRVSSNTRCQKVMFRYSAKEKQPNNKLEYK